MTRKSSCWVFNLLAPLIGIIVALLVVELLVYGVVKTHNLHLLPNNLAESIYYNTRHVIQFEPACAQYDREVGYLLKMNSRCSFANYEFPSTDYSINRMGIRDTDQALSSPEFIFVGDSYTMGWGVNQEEAFPQVFAAMTGKKSLNSGIASYGTAREMMLLRRLITNDTKQIVLQYCPNDFNENKQYVDAGYHLKIKTEDEYLELTNKSRNYPGYYCKILYFHILENLKAAINKPAPNPMADKQLVASYFLRTLAHNKDLLLGRKLSIIICPANKALLDVIGKELSSMKELQGISIKLIDTDQLLQSSDEYLLDKHYKPSAHKKIATVLAQELVK